MTPRELAILWAGGPAIAPELVEQAAILLEATPCFARDLKRPFLYRLADAEPVARQEAAATGALGQQETFEVVDRLFPPETGLYRRGLLPEERALLLAFHFPDVAASRYAEELAALANKTGYTARLKGEPHMGELASRALRALPTDGSALKPPSIRLGSREVALKVPANTRLDAQLVAEFEAATGFRLAVEVAAETQAAPPRFDAHGRMEINAAYAAVDAAFQGRPHAPRKKSRRVDASGPFIEVAFISRAVGERYQDALRQLEWDTGWNIRLAASADQAAILATVKALVPEVWGLSKTPSLHLASGEIAIRTSAPPLPDDVRWLAEEVEGRTGFRLRLATD